MGDVSRTTPWTGGVRSYVVTQIKSPLKQAGFISSRAQAVKKLAEDIALVLEELDGDIHVNT